MTAGRPAFCCMGTFLDRKMMLRKMLAFVMKYGILKDNSEDISGNTYRAVLTAQTGAVMRKRTGKAVFAMAAVCLMAVGSVPVFAIDVLEPTGIEDDMPEPQTAEEPEYGDEREDEDLKAEKNGKVAVIYTGDVHGRVSSEEDPDVIGYDGAAALKQELIAQGYEVLMFDAGGSAQGTALVNESRGAAAIEFMNAAGYDLMVPGNHELAWGPDVLLDNVMMAGFPVVAANIIDENGEETLLDAHTVFELENDMKVGVFGLVTPQTVVRTGSKEVSGLTFFSEQALYECAQAQIDELKEEECDLIICVGHLGEDESFMPDRAYDVIANTKGIDLFIDGHGHAEIQLWEGDTLLVSSGAYFAQTGVVIWDPEKNILESAMISGMEYDESDPDVAALIFEKKKMFEDELMSVIGTSQVMLDGSGVCTEETNLGNLAADALLWQAEKTCGYAFDCALLTAGAIRASVQMGDLSMGTILDVFPDENYIVELTLTGEELQAILEIAFEKFPAESSHFVQIAGITAELEAEEGNTIRVVSVGKSAFEPDMKYRTAVDEEMLADKEIGKFLENAYRENGYTTGARLADALNGFVTEHLDGVIDETYAQAAGRIVVR